MRLIIIKFVLIIVFLVIGFYTEAVASETSDRVAEKNLMRNLNRTEGEYRAAEGSYNSINEQLDKINIEIEGLNKSIETSQAIINQIEMGVFSCSSEDFRDFRRNDKRYKDGGGSFIECSAYIRNREGRKVQSLKDKINKLEYKKKPLQEQLHGAKADLDEKKDNYTVAKENYDDFQKFKEEQSRNEAAFSATMESYDKQKKDVVRRSEQTMRGNAEFFNEKPQYSSPRTWRPRD